MNRPPLSSALSAHEFRQWYWLKSELQSFCRANGLLSGGSKEAIAARIDAHLSGAPIPPDTKARSVSTVMPDPLTAATRIGPGWRLTRALRQYFEQVHGPGFAFNQALRQFIASGAGRTLAEASECYRASLCQHKPAIGRQFEYNRHTRAFFANNPGATREQALASWWARRARRGAKDEIDP